ASRTDGAIEGLGKRRREARAYAVRHRLLELESAVDRGLLGEAVERADPEISHPAGGDVRSQACALPRPTAGASTLVDPACLPVVAADHERTPVATVHSCLRPTPHQLEVERLRPLGTPDHTRLPSACLHRDREPAAVARLLHTTVLELR